MQVESRRQMFGARQSTGGVQAGFWVSAFWERSINIVDVGAKWTVGGKCWSQTEHGRCTDSVLGVSFLGQKR